MDGEQVTSLEQLNTKDLTNVESQRPLLKEGLAEVTLKSLELKDQKSPKTGKNLIVVLVTNNEQDGREAGKKVAAGYKHTETVSLTATENYNPDERLAALQECFVGTKGRFNAGDMIGRTGTVRFKIESDKDYGDKNRVQSWLKKKVSATPTLA